MAKNNNYEKIVNKLMELHYTISTMESCSGGCIASAITNVKGSSQVFDFSAVCYNREYIIHLGVNPKLIEKYGVYSTNISKEMAKVITRYANAQIGIGVTGNLNLITNDGSKGGEVYISIYNKETKEIVTKVITIKSKDREKAKEAIVDFIGKDLMKMLSID